MFPRLTIDQIPYCVLANIVFICKFLLSYPTGIVAPADFYHLIVSQLCAPAFHPDRFSLPSFGNHILRIVEICTKEQMMGIYTGAIVAFMTNKQTVWNGRIREFISEPMSGSITRSVSKFAIAAIAYIAAPKPAVTRFAPVYQCPKIFLCWMLSKAMSTEKTTRLALDPSVALVVTFGYLGFSSAAAMAIPVGDFVRGMITHSKFSLLGLARATGRFAVVAVVILSVVTAVIIPHKYHLKGMFA